MAEQQGTEGGEASQIAPAGAPRPGQAVAVLRELSPTERRVALVPDDVAKLVGLGLEVLVESGAGAGAFHADEAYAAAGATIADRDRLLSSSDLTLSVSRPVDDDLAKLRASQVVIGMLAPLVDPEYARHLASTGATAMSLDALPRTSAGPSRWTCSARRRASPATKRRSSAPTPSAVTSRSS